MHQQTSLLAYTSIKGELGPKQAAVMEAIEEYGPLNNRSIAEHLGWPINTVTPRVKELRAKGKVEAAYIGTDSQSGRSAIYWRVKP